MAAPGALLSPGLLPHARFASRAPARRRRAGPRLRQLAARPRHGGPGRARRDGAARALLAVAVLSEAGSGLLPADWAVLAAYLCAIVALGLYVGRRTRSVSDFFLAGREMRWWAAGLSVM